MDYSQPLYFSTRAKEKVSEASAKHEGLGVGKRAKYLVPHPNPVKSDVLHCVKFSRDSIRASKDRIKIRENRGL